MTSIRGLHRGDILTKYLLYSGSWELTWTWVPTASSSPPPRSHHVSWAGPGGVYLGGGLGEEGSSTWLDNASGNVYFFGTPNTNIVNPIVSVKTTDIYISISFKYKGTLAQYSLTSSLLLLEAKIFFHLLPVERKLSSILTTVLLLKSCRAFSSPDRNIHVEVTSRMERR